MFIEFLGKSKAYELEDSIDIIETDLKEIVKNTKNYKRYSTLKLLSYLDLPFYALTLSIYEGFQGYKGNVIDGAKVILNNKAFRVGEFEDKDFNEALFIMFDEKLIEKKGEEFILLDDFKEIVRECHKYAVTKANDNDYYFNKYLYFQECVTLKLYDVVQELIKEL